MNSAVIGSFTECVSKYGILNSMRMCLKMSPVDRLIVLNRKTCILLQRWYKYIGNDSRYGDSENTAKTELVRCNTFLQPGVTGSDTFMFDACYGEVIISRNNCHSPIEM